MTRWKEVAQAIGELQEEGQLDIFVGEHSVTFEVAVDDQGVYLTICPHCIAEAVNLALGGEEQSAPPDCEVH
ncbi:MAG: hypothetical protein ACNA8J_05140 [Gammaproteobacteria bacterium]